MQGMVTMFYSSCTGTTLGLFAAIEGCLYRPAKDGLLEGLLWEIKGNSLRRGSHSSLIVVVYEEGV